MSDRTDEKRISPRTPIELRVDYKRVNSFLADYTKNISKGGTFIRTDKPLAIGTRFHFRISVPGLEPVSLIGDVAWLSDGKSGDVPGMGIRFVYDDAPSRVKFESVVEKLMETNFGRDLAAKLMKK